jgi:hypothetical protein
MTRLRPTLVIVLAVTIAGAGVVAITPTVQDHLDRPSREQAQRVAHALPAPVGANVSTVCHGEGQVACWEIGASVIDVAQQMSRAVQQEAGKAATSTCEQVPVGTAKPAVLADACFVRVRFGDHGTFVFIDPVSGRDPVTGAVSVVGARVSLSAA